MSIIVTIIIGFVVGLLARALMPGRQKMGFILTVCLGIAGSLAASFLNRAMGWSRPGETAGFIVSLVGAMVLLFIVGLARRNA